MNYFFEYIANVSELASLVVAIIFYRRIKGSFMFWFLPFLAFILVAELITKYQSFTQTPGRTEVNFLIAIIVPIFYGYIFSQLIKSKKIIRLIMAFVFLNVSVFILTYFFVVDRLPYFMVNIIVTGFVMTAIALMYLYREFARNEHESIKQSSGFWIAVGVSLFYSTTCFVWSAYQFISMKSLFIFDIDLLNFVPRLASIILYGCISVSIIVFNRNTCNERPIENIAA